MSEIIKKELLADNIYRLRIDAPHVAKKRKAGQFIILRTTSEGERIPLTIANANSEEGWIEIVFQAIGASTMELAEFGVGDHLSDVAGPLGQATHIENYGECLCIGGGVGIAPLFPIVEALYLTGNRITSIIGAKTKKQLILEYELSKISSKMFVATDDGSYGHHGFVTDVVNQLLAKGDHFDFCMVIGPAPMMKAASSITLSHGIQTFASLNPIMIDGTGMCGGCRVSVFNETKFACVDGPEFNASGIDWDLLVKRQNSYKSFEISQRDEQSCRVDK